MFPQLVQGLSKMKQFRILPLHTLFEVQILQLLFKMKMPHRTKKSPEVVWLLKQSNGLIGEIS